MLSESNKIVKLLAPAADRFNTNPVTDAVTLEDADALTALVYHQGGTTGKATLTVEACSAADGTGAEAIGFRYRKTDDGASDTWSAIAVATSAGIDTDAATEKIVELEVKAEDLPAGKKFVRVKLTEAANDPVNAAVVGILSGVRYKGISIPSVLA